MLIITDQVPLPSGHLGEAHCKVAPNTTEDRRSYLGRIGRAGLSQSRADEYFLVWPNMLGTPPLTTETLTCPGRRCRGSHGVLQLFSRCLRDSVVQKV